MASYLAFNFGIEIELLLASRTKNHKSWHSLATELSIRLNAAGISNHLNEGEGFGGDSPLETYAEWSITREVTIPPQAGKGLWGLELVSPILNSSVPWTSQIHQIFSVLKTHFALTPSAHCSTHVHISCSPSSLQDSPHTLASIAKSILYFEPALDSLFPADRSSSYWCQSNRSNPVLKHLSMTQCFEYIDSCAAASSSPSGYPECGQYPAVGYTVSMSPAAAAAAGTTDFGAGIGGIAATTATTEIVRAMNLFPAKSAYGRAHGYTEDFVHGVYKWDLSNLLLAGGTSNKQTIEFRQAPGSLRTEDVRTWVELAVSFVAGAVDIWSSSLSSASASGLGGANVAEAEMVSAAGLDPERRVTMEDLWWVLRSGAQSSGIGDLRGVEKLFLSSSKAKGSKKGRK